MKYLNKSRLYLFLFIVGLLMLPPIAGAQNKKLTFEDVMHWEDISRTVISPDGQWLAYNVWPDRGDGEVRIRNIDKETTYTIPLGKNPRMTNDSKWVAAYVEPKLAEQIKAKKDKPKRGLMLLNMETGEKINVDSVQSYTFSDDGHWVVARIYQSKSSKKKAKKNEYLGNPSVLINLSTGEKERIPFVKETSFAKNSTYLAYSLVNPGGAGNGLYYRNLDENPSDQQEIKSVANAVFANLSWDEDGTRLAFTEAGLNKPLKANDASLNLWNASKDKVQTLVEPSEVREGWALRTSNTLDWSDDGQQLYFGLKPQSMVDIIQRNKEDQEPASINIYDIRQILDKKGLDIWSTKDTLIKPNAKNMWNRHKAHTYRAVYHLKTHQWAQLSDQQLPNVRIPHNSKIALGYSKKPYLHAKAWNRTFRDYYVVDLSTGKRTLAAKRLRYYARLSPQGRYVVFYKDKQWHLYNIKKDIYRNLTKDVKESFYNVTYSRPQTPPPYGIAGWTQGDKAVLIYGQYNIWKFSTGQEKPVNLTLDGKKRDIRYRIVRTDRDRHFFEPEEKLLLRGFYYHKRTYGFYTLTLDNPGTTKRLESKHRYDFVVKAKNTNRIIFTRESYDEYPNLWVSNGLNFKDTHQVTGLHLNLHDKYNWGTSEIISWTNLDGETLQGALIKPDNYSKNKKYPVLVYFYAGGYANRAYEFNHITNDDRPTIPQYVSNGYVVFLPNIKFTVGTPGFSATKSLVPGVLKLIELGIADKDKIGIHGHSWGGYETAFIITQTDLFSAAVAGAPVANMTSSYSGIRLSSGRARQSQYEIGQSRIGGSLWEYPELYIENSPLFYANRIHTPLLIMAGDKDNAVPWYQDKEMFLAMRRLGKTSALLQYHGEPHHLQRYANRLDYAIKMKQYFDYYLRGIGDPKWIIEGAPYTGK